METDPPEETKTASIEDCGVKKREAIHCGDFIEWLNQGRSTINWQKVRQDKLTKKKNRPSFKKRLFVVIRPTI